MNARPRDTSIYINRYRRRSHVAGAEIPRGGRLAFAPDEQQPATTVGRVGVDPLRVYRDVGQ